MHMSVHMPVDVPMHVYSLHVYGATIALLSTVYSILSTVIRFDARRQHTEPERAKEQRQPRQSNGQWSTEQKKWSTEQNCIDTIHRPSLHTDSARIHS